MSNDKANKPLPTLQELMERDKEKIVELTKSKNANKVDPEWALLAEFGLYFGWRAIEDVRTNKISYSDMLNLTKGARALRAAERYNRLIDLASALSGTNSEKGKTALKKLLTEIEKQWQTK